MADPTDDLTERLRIWAADGARLMRPMLHLDLITAADEIDQLRVISAALLDVVCRLVEWEDGDTHLPISFLTDLMNDARRMTAVVGGGGWWMRDDATIDAAIALVDLLLYAWRTPDAGGVGYEDLVNVRRVLTGDDT